MVRVAGLLALFGLDEVPYTPYALGLGNAAMKTQEIESLMEQLGELTEVQRSALMIARDGKGSANGAIALVEIRYAAAPACGRCGF